MSVFDEIDALVLRSANLLQKTRIQKLALYREGLKAKITQADYALAKLSDFENRSDETESSTAAGEFGITDRVHFYCDSFWIFLYSSLADFLSNTPAQTFAPQGGASNDPGFFGFNGKYYVVADGGVIVEYPTAADFANNTNQTVLGTVPAYADDFGFLATLGRIYEVDQGGTVFKFTSLADFVNNTNGKS